MNKKIYPLLFLLVLFLALRIPAAMTSLPEFFETKELYIGTVARELIQGLKFPFFDHQLRHNVGGSLVSGVLAVPYFLILGQSYFTLKLFAITWSAAILVLWYVFLARYFSRRAAFVAGLLFIFSPPFFAKFSLTSYGQHAEANLFIVLGLLLFFRIFSGGAKKLRDYAWFGILSGFAMYYDPIYFGFLAACLIFWLVYERRVYLREEFLVFLGSFALGFAPWIYYHTRSAFRFVCLNDRFPETGRTMAELFPPNIFVAGIRNFLDFLVFRLPDSFCFDSGPLGRVNYFCYFAFLVAVFYVAKKCLRLDPGMPTAQRRTGLFLVFFLPFYLMLMSVIAYPLDLVDHDFYRFYGYRRFLPFYPFFFACMALSLDWALARKRKFLPGAFICLTATLLGLGAAGGLRMIHPHNFRNFLYYPGYSYVEFGNLMARRAGADINRAIGFAARIGESDRPLFYEGIGIYWAYSFSRCRPLEECLRELSAVGPRYRSYAIRGAGLGVAADCWNRLDQTGRIFSSADRQSQPDLYEGAGEWTGFIWGYRPELALKMAGDINADFRLFFYRGMGRAVGYRFGQDVKYCIRMGEGVPAGYRPAYFFGLASQE